MTNTKLKPEKIQSRNINTTLIVLVSLIIILIKFSTTTYSQPQNYNERVQYVKDEVVIQAILKGPSERELCEYWTERCDVVSFSIWDLIGSSGRFLGPDGGWLDPLAFSRCTYDIDKAIVEMTMDITSPLFRGTLDGGGTITTTENQRAYERGRSFEEKVNQGILGLRQKLLDVENNN